jgi:cytochrome c nitrite reductase small subunit
MHLSLSKHTIARMVLGLAVGLAAGMGCYTFIYAKGASYLSDDPGACANCHIMNEQFDGWLKSSHRAVATCNDCHTPHTTVAKYMTKASHGFWHSFYFTTGTFHDPIRLTPSSERTTEAACRYCHSEITDAIDTHEPDGERMSCIRCHRSVGHLH